MKASLFFLVSTLSIVTANSILETLDAEPELIFGSWMKEHNFRFDQDEHPQRFSIFKESLEMVRKHNSNPKNSFTMGLNRFSHLSNAELKKYLGDESTPQLHQSNVKFGDNCTDDASQPTSFDWRTKKAVSSAKDQGECGSCWAFAATSAMQLALAIKTGKIVDLSEENLIDCLLTRPKRCAGGFVEQAYSYTEKTGITTAKNYPYEDEDSDGNKCDDDWEVMYKMSRHIPIQGACAMKKNIIKSAVSVSFNVDKSFFHYKKGVYDVTTCFREGGHAVGLVGYGINGGANNATDYWIFKNSWGAKWGEGGFFKMARGKNLCTIESRPIVVYA